MVWQRGFIEHVTGMSRQLEALADHAPLLRHWCVQGLLFPGGGPEPPWDQLASLRGLRSLHLDRIDLLRARRMPPLAGIERLVVRVNHHEPDVPRVLAALAERLAPSIVSGALRELSIVNPHQGFWDGTRAAADGSIDLSAWFGPGLERLSVDYGPPKALPPTLRAVMLNDRAPSSLLGCCRQLESLEITGDGEMSYDWPLLRRVVRAPRAPSPLEAPLLESLGERRGVSVESGAYERLRDVSWSGDLQPLLRVAPGLRSLVLRDSPGDIDALADLQQLTWLAAVCPLDWASLGRPLSGLSCLVGSTPLAGEESRERETRFPALHTLAVDGRAGPLGVADALPALVVAMVQERLDQRLSAGLRGQLDAGKALRHLVLATLAPDELGASRPERFVQRLQVGRPMRLIAPGYPGLSTAGLYPDGSQGTDPPWGDVSDGRSAAAFAPPRWVLPT